MKKTTLSKLFTAGLAVASLGIAASRANAQCACPTGNIVEGGSYMAMAAPAELGPESLLEEVADDPATVCNLSVVVHDKAVVSVNGEPTVTMGTVRPYIVRGLKPEKSYKFEIQALLRQPKGDVYVAKETITLKGGESKQVVLKVRRANRADFPPPPPSPPVPAPAASGAPATPPAAK
jgi:uncharacterized protein (TIGR03000 family)